MSVREEGSHLEQQGRDAGLFVSHLRRAPEQEYQLASWALWMSHGSQGRSQQSSLMAIPGLGGHPTGVGG